MKSFVSKDPENEVQVLTNSTTDVLQYVWYVVLKVFEIFRMFWLVRKLPGLPSNPLLGHIQYFMHPTKWLKKVQEFQEIFPTCQKIYLLFYPIVFVYSPEGMQEILSRKQKHNDKGSFYHTMIPILGDGLITSKGEKWLNHRRMITPAFHFNILESFFEVFKSRTIDYINVLKESCRSKEYLDICPFNKELTMNFILETAIGLPEGFHSEKQLEIVRALQREIYYVCRVHHHKKLLDGLSYSADELLLQTRFGISPSSVNCAVMLPSTCLVEYRLEEIALYRCWKPWLLNEWIFQWTHLYKEQEMHRNILNSFTNKIIIGRRSALINQTDQWVNYSKKNVILIDILLRQILNGAQLTDQEIREEVTTFVYAGQTTTHLALSYCIFLLGLHPECQEKARQEVDDIFGDSDREPTMNDLKLMNYIEMCLKETLRLYPSVPVLARRLTEDQKIGDYLLPKNTDCIIFPYVLHRNPQQFKNPENFNPDNFLPENSKNRHVYSYIPFSAGPRNCVGKRFAITALKTVISWVLREFTIESLKKQDKVKLMPSAVLVPLGGLPVKLTPRKK